MSDWGLAFHAVQSAKDLLANAGFQEIKVLRATPQSYLVGYLLTTSLGERFLGVHLQARRQVLPDQEYHHSGGFCHWKAMEGMKRKPNDSELSLIVNTAWQLDLHDRCPYRLACPPGQAREQEEW